ncbi:MAG: ABC transporter ATP-binding protein [Desulfobacteraceae bacterium]|jgi:putative ABC transport system ATP-binding protein
MIELNHISKRYATRRHTVDVLSNVNLKITGGECVCLRGPSGTGKTTLLHIIGGMLSPTTGDVMVFDQSLPSMPQHMLSTFRRKHIGFVFQHYHLLKNLTVMDNLLLPVMPSGAALKPHRSRLQQLLERFQIGHRSTFPVHCLSGGEQQRVAIARALANDPDIILADEPFSNIDEDNTRFIVSMLIELKNAGKTLVLTSTQKGFDWEKRFIDRDICYATQ